MSFFYHDLESSVSWESLIEDINQTEEYNPYCYEADYYKIFKKIILSIILDEKIVLLDGDFSKDEIQRIIGDVEIDTFIQKVDDSKIPKLASKEDLIQAVLAKKNHWRLSIFSSGTTGLPKKVEHSLEGITRFVRRNENHVNDVWGYAYNPTHMAGLQVFFQALLNGNTIVRLFGLSSSEIFSQIEKHGVTNISATPTFYKLLLNGQQSMPSVQKITSGGEKLDAKLIDILRKTFPNAKIKNVYASTEAGSLFASDNDVFKIKDSFGHLVKVEENELHLHQSLLGYSDLFEGEWYATGDIVEVVAERPLQIKFVSRNNDLINVSGYQVNLIEVEECVNSHPSIKMAVVYAKSNSLIGNIVCCEAISTDSELNEAELRNYLQGKLQEFKIPRIIRFVDHLQKTNTGKIKRKK